MVMVSGILVYMRKLSEFTLHSVVGVTALIGIFLGVSLFISNPDQLGPFGITVWFVGLWVFLSGLFGLVRLGIGRILRFKQKKSRAISFRQGALVAAWAVSLLAFQSLGQLGAKDIVLVSLLVLLVEFYVRRASSS